MENSQENQEKEIKIAPATLDDVRGMVVVFHKAWLETYPNEELGITIDDVEDKFKDSYTDEELKNRAERIANLPEGQTVLCAKEGDKVVGLCRIVIHSDKNQLQAIYVLPEYQGKGIGTKLWEEAQKVFDPDKDIIVQVATYNAKAIGFYEKLGFTDTGKRFSEERHRMKSGAYIPEMEMIIRKSESK